MIHMPWYWLVLIIAAAIAGIVYYRTARRHLLREVILLEVRFTTSTICDLLALRLRYKEIRGNRAKFQRAVEVFFLKRYKRIKRKFGWGKLAEVIRCDREALYVPHVVLDAISEVLRSHYFSAEFNTYVVSEKNKIMQSKNSRLAKNMLTFLGSMPDELQLENRLDVLTELNALASEAVS